MRKQGIWSGSTLKVQPLNYFGYRFSQKLPCVIIKSEYKFNEMVDIDNIDDFISRYMGMDIKDYNFPKTDGESQSEVQIQAREIYFRALVLYRDFLTCSGIPCYEPGAVVRVDPVPDKADSVTVAVTLQVMDNLSIRQFGKLFEDALALVQGELNGLPSPEAADRLLWEFKENVLDKFCENLPFRLAQQSILGIAAKNGIPYRHLGRGLLKLGWGSKSRLLQYSWCDADSLISMDICNDKFMTSLLLRAAGLPGAANFRVGSVEEAIEAAGKMGWPVVVKPLNRDRSEGVTTNVTNDRDLVAAYEVASQFGKRVLVETQAPGDCYRILIANDRLVYAVRRLPKGVVGDGKSSVAELAQALNSTLTKRPPWWRLKIWPVDDETDECLADQGLSRDSVPEEGRRVHLRTIQSSQWGGEIDDLTRDIHPDNVRLAVEATRLMSMSISGVDLMTTDFTRPWHETGAIINEMNLGPEFNWIDREEAARNVIPALLDGDGRIPVHLVAGEGDLLAAARSIRDDIVAQGRKCHLTTATFSEDDKGEKIHMASSTIFERSLAMIMRPDVDELVIAGTPRGLFQDGFAVDRFETATAMQWDETKAKELLAALEAHVAIATTRWAKPLGARADINVRLPNGQLGQPA